MKFSENPNWTKVTGGKSLILFFDEGKLRKCTQKDDKEVEIHQSTSYPI